MVDKIYKGLLLHELSQNNLQIVTETIIQIPYDECILKSFKMQHPIINNTILCNVIAFKKNIKLEIMKTQTYLRNLDAPIGLVIHFGKEKLQIFGVCPP